MARMKLLDLIKWVRLLLPLLQLPDWKSAEDTRIWALQLLGVAGDLADETATEVDDEAVDALTVVANDPIAWETLHSLILGLVTDDDSGATVDESRVMAVSDKVGISPALILMIVQAAMQIISWWRSRESDTLPPTENID